MQGVVRHGRNAILPVSILLGCQGVCYRLITPDIKLYRGLSRYTVVVVNSEGFLGLQSRFGGKPFKFRVVCPQNVNTAVLNGLGKYELTLFARPNFLVH